MKLFDSHCHLDDKVFAADIEAVLGRAAKAGVLRMLCAGVTLETSKRAVALAERFEGVHAAVGVHPHDVRHCTEKALELLVELSRRPQVCAWGEIGLDFNRMHSPRRDQEKWFVRQLEIAAQLDLPIIFHERESGGRFLEILRAHAGRNARGVVHCFSGSQSELEHYLQTGLHIGITGIVTMPERGRELRKMIALIPTERMLVETDAPYLTPLPEKRDYRRNEPAFVRSVMMMLARILNDDPDLLASKIWQNTCRLYGLEAGSPESGKTG